MNIFTLWFKQFLKNHCFPATILYTIHEIDFLRFNWGNTEVQYTYFQVWTEYLVGMY